jgi:hypothetical protein
MVITILRADVDENKWANLRRSYSQKASKLPPEVIETFLIQDTGNLNVWEIVTLWRSMEDLESMRNSGQTPTGVIIFNEAGVSPELSIFNVSKRVKH